MELPTYYSVVPATVRYDNNLSNSEKIMYSEISALVNMGGSCFATNKYFAKLYGVHTGTISRWVSNLEKQGHIKVIMDEGGRTIMLTPLHNNVNTPSQKGETPLRKNVKHNNTSKNKKNIILSGEVNFTEMIQATKNKKLIECDGLVERLNAFREHRRELKKPITVQAGKVLVNKLSRLSDVGESPICLLDTAMERGWLTVYPSRKDARQSDGQSVIRGGIL